MKNEDLIRREDALSFLEGKMTTYENTDIEILILQSVKEGLLTIPSVKAKSFEQESNKALTIEELRQMVDLPIYIVIIRSNRESQGRYDIITKIGKYYIETARGVGLLIDSYGKTWYAYRCKPEDDEKS